MSGIQIIAAQPVITHVRVPRVFVSHAEKLGFVKLTELCAIRDWTVLIAAELLASSDGL